jgi:hypothetical protein
MVKKDRSGQIEKGKENGNRGYFKPSLILWDHADIFIALGATLREVCSKLKRDRRRQTKSPITCWSQWGVANFQLEKLKRHENPFCVWHYRVAVGGFSDRDASGRAK